MNAFKFGRFGLLLGLLVLGSGVVLGQDCSQFLTLPRIHILCPDQDSITLDAGSGFDEYFWSTGETTQIITVFEPESYDVTARTLNASGGVECVDLAGTQVIPDLREPIFTCPENITELADTLTCEAAIDVPQPIFLDDCSIPIFTNSYNGGPDAADSYPIGSTIVEFIANYLEGNAQAFLTCEFTVTVIDDLPPEVLCPANINIPVSLNACEENITITGYDVSDNCSDNLTLTNDINGTDDPSGIYPVGTTQVTLTVTDEEATFNTSSSCTFLVTVRDNAPRIECPANITRAVDADECGADVAVDPFVVINNCSDDAVVSDDFNNTGDPSGFYPVGTTVVTLTATDQENPGLSSSCSFVVTVSDNAPGITCPDDVIRAANPDACGADITFDALDVEDNCSDNAAVTNNINSISDPSGFYSVGTTVVILTVTDQTNPGLSSTCSFSVIVNDETPPTIVSCPGDLSVMASTGECEGVADFPLPEFSDNCGEVSVEGNVAIRDLIPLGLTEVVYIAEDDAGNESECQFTIEVLPANVDAMISGPTEFCPDEPATLTASGGGTYLWSTMETGPTIPITTPGIYSVTVTGPSGCTATASQTVTADCGELNANFTANQDTACVGFLANFQDNSTGNITGRLWDFGNGNFSEEVNPFAVFPDVGTYTVSLTVSNGAATNTFTQVVEIYPAIETDFSVALANGCDQREAQFTSTTQSTYPVDYAWNFGDGTTSSLVNPRHYFATFDTANVDLVVTDRFGCSAQSSMDIFIEDNLATPPTTVVDSILCAGGSVTVGNTVFNEGNLSGEVTLSTVAGCDSLVRVRLRFADAETTSLAADAGSYQPLCNNVSSLTLRGNLPPGLTGTWQALDGGVITDASSQATSVNEIQEGTSRFVWELSTVACGAFSRDTVTITREPARAEVADAGPDRGFCNEATEISLRAQATGSDVVLGRWEQNAEQQATGLIIDDINDPNTTISGAVADQIYTFTWTISTDRCGEFDRDTVRLALSNDALTPARISGEDISCGSVPVLITGNMPEGTTEAIFETLPGENNPTLTMVDADTVLVGDLLPGINTVIYTLSADNCPDYSSDTFRITTTGSVGAKADLVFKQERERVPFNVLTNDTIDNIAEIEFQLLSRPTVGDLVVGDRPGQFTYLFDEEDTEPISFAYRICVRGCPESCSQASVNLNFSRQPTLGAPKNVITPNGDDIGETFIVPNAEDYVGGVALIIFDRWGDKLYENDNYQNDWAGDDLPVGTYFYLIRAGVRNEFERTGSVTIIR